MQATIAAAWLTGCGAMATRWAVSCQVPRMYFPYTFHIPPMDLLVQQAGTASVSYRPIRARSSCRSLRPAAVLPALGAIQRLPIYGPAGEG
jgi:hypothetical protein